MRAGDLLTYAVGVSSIRRGKSATGRSNLVANQPDISVSLPSQSALANKVRILAVAKSEQTQIENYYEFTLHYFTTFECFTQFVQIL